MCFDHLLGISHSPIKDELRDGNAEKPGGFDHQIIVSRRETQFAPSILHHS
jgi:hypothetical protein